MTNTRAIWLCSGIFLSPPTPSFVFTDCGSLSSSPTPHDRQGRPSTPRAEPVTAHPARHGSTCYDMLRFTLPAEVWRAWFSTQVTIKHGFTTISLLPLVGRTSRLNCIVEQGLCRYSPRSRFPQKSPFRPLFRAFYPHPANGSSLRADGAHPLSGTRKTWSAPFRLRHAPRRDQRVQVVRRPFPAGYCLTPTTELAKTERGPISTSGPFLSV